MNFSKIEKEVIFLKAVNELIVSIKRVEFLRMCRNISKHNFSRLLVTAKEHEHFFNRNCIDIDLKHAPCMKRFKVTRWLKLRY